MTDCTSRIDIFFGRDIENVAERRCLRRLLARLAAVQTDAVVLANFVVGPQRRQVDLVIATAQTAIVIEIKGYTHPVHGDVNGPWQHLDLGDGKTRSLGLTNPYHQALDCRYAVCDALNAHAGLQSHAVRAAVLGSLCIFPAPLAASVLPASDHKLVVGGAAELETLLDQPVQRAVPLDTWRSFALSLQLSRGGDAEPSPASMLVESYVARFLELRRALAVPYIEPLVAGEQVATSELARHLRNGAQLHIVGPSGSGKSELLQALATNVAQQSVVPIIVQAAGFSGDFAPLLRRGIASATSATPTELFSAINGTGQEALLLVDGLNECQPNLRRDLISALQAAKLRFHAHVVTAGQEELALPPALQGRTIPLLQPDAPYARRLVESHLGRGLTQAELPSLEVIGTAHDAAILATVLQSRHAIDGRYALYAAFTSARTAAACGPTFAPALGGLATEMRDAFVTTMPVPACQRILARAGTDETLSAALRSGLLREDGGDVRFRHDLVAAYYAADQLLRTSLDQEALRAQTSRPINAELREFVLGGCATTTEIEALLAETPTEPLLKAGARGQCGNKVRAYILDRCRDVIAKLRRQFSSLQLELPPEFQGVDTFHSFHATFADYPGLDRTDRPYLKLLPHVLAQGLQTELLDLFGTVDQHIASEAIRLRAEHPDVRLNWVAAAYGSVYGVSFNREGQEMQHILSEMQMLRFDRRQPKGDAGIRKLLNNFEAYTPGQLFFLLAAFQGAHDEPLPTRTCELLRHLWGLGIYHLRLLTANVVGFHGRELPDSERQAVRELLNGWFSNNPWMNSIVIDALAGVGGLEPEIDIADAVAEYEALLEAPESPEASQMATGLLIRTYDHPFSEVYWEAFYDHLALEKRQAILLRAIHDETADAMFLADAVRALLDVPSPTAAPRLQQLAERPWAQNHSYQNAVQVYANAIVALARLDVPLEAQTQANLSPAELAWRRAGPLLHAFNRAGEAGDDEIRDYWSAFAACGPASVIDVVMHLQSEMTAYGHRAKVAFLERCASGLLEICRSVLSAEYVPVSIFDRFMRFTELIHDHRAFALKCMEQIGRRSDLLLLRQWLDNPSHGEAALAAARRIEDR